MKGANLPLLTDGLGGSLDEAILQEGDVLLLGNFQLAVAHPLLELSDRVA